ncbi:phosphopantetheine-binding protein [Dickeya dianthicola]|uniref:phosphopantetheine-binding protein n=1 Tax=Dickeya dianthicola TaxID=204039 RepID=UPI001866A2AB|nr:phosphopantetheine-binding protein [Dickeya dianthicola]QOL15826.1 hypothetical protein HGI48_17485 [Dickeya dianthicola]
MDMTASLFLEVKILLAQVMEKSELENSLNEDDNIATDLGIDSIQMINFFLMLEDKYNLAFDYESIEIENFTIRRCCELINTLQNPASITE